MTNKEPLPQWLLNLIADYGHERSSGNVVQWTHAWEELIGGIKRYASTAPAALLPWTYDYWREGLCGTEPTAANIVAYNGEDVKAIGRVTNAGERADIIRKHNDVVRRLLASPAPAASDSRGNGVVDERFPDDGNGDDDAYNRGWNECRKSMLASAPAPPAVASGEPVSCDAIPQHDWEILTCEQSEYEPTLEGGWRRCRTCGMRSTFTRKISEEK